MSLIAIPFRPPAVISFIRTYSNTEKTALRDLGWICKKYKCTTPFSLSRLGISHGPLDMSQRLPTATSAVRAARASFFREKRRITGDFNRTKK